MAEAGKVVEVTAGIKVSSHTEGKLTIEAEGWEPVEIKLGIPGIMQVIFRKKTKKK